VRYIGRRANRAARTARFLAAAAKVFSILAPVAATIFLFLARDDTTLFSWAVVALLVSAGVQLTGFLWERRLATRTLADGNVLNTLVSQMAAAVSNMPEQSEEQRNGTLNEVARHAVDSLVNLYRDSHDIRAIVYSISPDQSELAVYRYAGVRRPSGRFIRGDGARGDKALDFVLDPESKSLFIPNLKKEKPEDYGGSGNGYNTFISSQISSGTAAYGMLTVDAAKTGDLTEDDIHVVELFAGVLAIAFAQTAEGSVSNSETTN
jgi:GAF domain-containing protein